MQAAIIIPARLQSTRLPEKLLLAETGMPLICHTILRATAVRDRSAGLFTEIIVAADNHRIINAVESFTTERRLPVRAVMTNPNHQSGSDRIAEAATTLPPAIDAILNLQGDEPDIDADNVLALAAFHERAGTDISTLVFPLASREERENPALVKAVLGADGRALYFSRSDIPYRRDTTATVPTYGHVGIYLYRRPALEKFVSLPPGTLEQTEKLEQLRALENGISIAAHVLASRPAKGIDTPEDYADFVRRTASR
ncbi:MAG: 3-deoxy-manno-octulosonate cytidylyltransferase [Planctomycetes bacterium]|nr:3-deoxy-manno-octulosonate cytidylyltransferase [Planctomycetota bacterium]